MPHHILQLLCKDLVLLGRVDVWPGHKLDVGLCISDGAELNRVQLHLPPRANFGKRYVLACGGVPGEESEWQRAEKGKRVCCVCVCVEEGE